MKRLLVFSKFNGHCAYCGDHIKIVEMQIDHVISKRNFTKTIEDKIKVPSFLKHLTILDLDNIDNLFPACKVCNNWKNTFDLELFRKEISEQLNRLNKYSASYRMATKYGLLEAKETSIVFYFENVDNGKA